MAAGDDPERGASRRVLPPEPGMAGAGISPVWYAFFIHLEDVGSMFVLTSAA